MFQVKVEYFEDKFVSFFVDMVAVYSGSYGFTNLVEDITSRCSNLSYLNPLTIRIRYEDDEGSLINLQYGDEAGFCEMWNNARVVTDRDYKRIKIKACEVDSPAIKAAKASMISREKNVATVDCATAEPPSKKQLFEGCPQSPQISLDSCSTPLERLFASLEEDITKTKKKIEQQQKELSSMETKFNDALETNRGRSAICGKCHLREGHTKRNCTLGNCLSATACGIIDKHPEEKGQKRKLESDIASDVNKLNKLQENYRKKQVAYGKINQSFSSKIEKGLIESNPDLYVNNGCKNWTLISKHTAILEKKCKGRIPMRSEIPALLNEALQPEHVLKQRKSIPTANPMKSTLQEHGIVFPNTSNLPKADEWPVIQPPRLSSPQALTQFVLPRVSRFASPQEEGDFYFAKSLQLRDLHDRQYGKEPDHACQIAAKTTVVNSSSTSTSTCTNLDMLALAAEKQLE